MKRSLVAHELGHAVCAEVQDGFWYACGLSFKAEDGQLACCYTEKLDRKKPNIKGPYSRVKNMVSLGGIFGELLYHGAWSPWSARADVDEFATENRTTKNKVMLELDSWMWRDDDDLSYRFCTNRGIAARRNVVLDIHDTARRLPFLWDAYLDFCDRIDKEAFLIKVEEVSTGGNIEIESDQLRAIIKEIVV
jgi:hypothetical protein